MKWHVSATSVIYDIVRLTNAQKGPLIETLMSNGDWLRYFFQSLLTFPEMNQRPDNEGEPFTTVLTNPKLLSVVKNFQKESGRPYNMKIKDKYATQLIHKCL